MSLGQQIGTDVLAWFFTGTAALVGFFGIWLTGTWLYQSIRNYFSH